jgi:hypothetical protein
MLKRQGFSSAQKRNPNAMGNPMTFQPPDRKDSTTYRKKLIEVALPLKEINEQPAREKSIRHGPPSTTYLWRARPFAPGGGDCA